MLKGFLQITALVLFCLLQAASIKASREEAQERLYQKLFGRGNSRRTFLPRLSDKHPINVQFKFTLINIKDVNAKEQFINVYGWVTQKWEDPFLRWNSSEFDDIKVMLVDPDKIWVPDVLLYNNLVTPPSVDVQDHTAGGRTTYNLDVSVNSNGTAQWSSPAIFKSVCNINVINFPFDEQRCDLKFGPWSLDSSKLKLTTWDSNGKSPSYVTNGEWELLDLVSTPHTVTYGSVNYDDVTVTIHIGRNFFNYCVNLIIPCALISCMIFLGFILPPESGERIGLSITVLLAMTVFQQLTSQIFPSFDFPLLGQYYFATSVELSLALGASALVINFSFRKTTRMPRWMRKSLLVWLAKVVFLEDRVNKSRPKRPDGSIKLGDAAFKRDIEVSDHRTEDRLVQELTEVMNNPAKDFDYGGKHFVNTRNGSVKGTLNGGVAFSKKTTEEPSVTFESVSAPVSTGQRSHITGDDGNEVSEEELAVREWEWKQATQVLDRFFFWMSVIVGLVTLFAIFPRAPRLQKALGF